MSAADEPRAQARERRGHPGPHVGRAADHAEAADRAGIDLAQVEAVGVGMALDLEHRADEDVAEAGGGTFDVFDLEPGQRQAAAQLVDVGLDRDELGEPAERQLHDDDLVAEALDRGRSRGKRRELSEKAQVVFEEQPHVVDAELEQRLRVRRPSRRRSPGIRPGS